MSMTLMTVTFYAEDGTQRVGELVEAATVLSNDGKTAVTHIDRLHSDEVAVLTLGPDAELQMHKVLVGNVRYIRPVTLPLQREGGN